MRRWFGLLLYFAPPGFGIKAKPAREAIAKEINFAPPGFGIKAKLQSGRGAQLAYWRAALNGPSGPIINPGEDGLFQIYQNEFLTTEQTVAIFEYFHSHQECHPDFQWRSLKADLEALNQRAED